MRIEKKYILARMVRLGTSCKSLKSCYIQMSQSVDDVPSLHLIFVCICCNCHLKKFALPLTVCCKMVCYPVKNSEMKPGMLLNRHRRTKNYTFEVDMNVIRTLLSDCIFVLVETCAACLHSISLPACLCTPVCAWV